MKNQSSSKKIGLRTLMFWGIASTIAYILLYIYSNQVLAFSEKVHEDQTLAVCTPITIAFTFSVIHGNFTSHFWEYLGFTAKSK